MFFLKFRLWRNKIFNLPGIFGRSRTIDGKTEFQHLREHLHGTAKRCSEFCAKFKAGLWGLYLGLFHDTGKASDPFQHGRLCVDPADVRQEHVDHSTFGGRFLFNRLKAQGQEPAGKIMAFTICGHHSGLTNDSEGQTENMPKHVLQWKLNQQVIPPVFERAMDEYKKIRLKKLSLPGTSFKRYVFSKMLFSSLIDADRLDSAEYKDKEYKKSREALRTYESLPSLYKKMKKHLKNLAHKENRLKIDILRTGIQKRCYRVASAKKGFFTLTVPTGGGKTLGSVMFALKHAVKHRMDRVIILSSYITILDQNAEELQKILGIENVLEHHCRFERDKLYEGRRVYDDDNLTKHFLAVENWEAPVIMATNVNFFESLYSFNASRCRKLHNIVNSVIILDEAHLLPPRLIKPCIKILKELVETYNCSVVFCTATQPGLLKESGLLWAVDKAREIIKNPSSLYKQLERIKYEYHPEIKCDNQLTHMIRRFQTVMCIVNTRRHALMMYEDQRRLRLNRIHIYHLSTLMCASHRKLVLERIKNDLNDGCPCRVISTQLVECGVCLDFPVIIRNRSGLASFIQSGGRCNREGRLMLPDGTPDKGLLLITEVGGAGHELKDNFAEAEINIARSYLQRGEDLLGPDISTKAFVELYTNYDNRLDKENVLHLIDEQDLHIPFYEISRRFRIIEAAQESVITPWDEKSRNLVEKLRTDIENGAPEYMIIKTARALQPYVVQVYPADLEKIQYAIDESVVPYRILRHMDLYDGPTDVSPGTGLKIWSQSDLNKYYTLT